MVTFLSAFAGRTPGDPVANVEGVELDATRGEAAPAEGGGSGTPARRGQSEDVFPTGLARFIRKAAEGHGNQRVGIDGAFGLLPFCATPKPLRCAPASNAPGHAGAALHRPVRGELRQELGKAVRWKISQPGDVSMGVAGIYETWKNPATGPQKMLTGIRGR